MTTTNLLGLDRAGFESFCTGLGEKRFRALQLMRWVHHRGCADIDAMSDLARSFRERLRTTAEVVAPSVLTDRVAPDGTRKWLFDVGSGNAIEAVFIPEARRGTLCISSQAGCAVDCRFCATGKQGFSRNLRTDEILGQVWLANRFLRSDPAAVVRLGVEPGSEAAREAASRPVSNVVFMGMGEPLLNYEAVLPALRALLDEHGAGLSRRRLTVSTSGVVPMIERLGRDCPVALAVSLHAGNDALRDRLVPINRKYPLAQLLAACRAYLKVAPRDFITFEYVMLAGVNDSIAQAHELVRLLADVPCKLNLIPFNGFEASGLRRSSDAAIDAFAQVLGDAGLVTTVRRTRGDDIAAACGQLAGEVVDRTRRAARVQPLVRVGAGTRVPGPPAGQEFRT